MQLFATTSAILHCSGRRTNVTRFKKYVLTQPILLKSQQRQKDSPLLWIITELI